MSTSRVQNIHLIRAAIWGVSLAVLVYGSAVHAQPPLTVSADRLAPVQPQLHATVQLAPVQPGPHPPPPLSPGGSRDDCNGNGIPDECDLSCAGDCTDYPECGQSLDCQPDGIPDECQLYGFEQVYQWEDGTSEYGLRSAGTHLAWLNNFVVVGDAGLIDALDLTFVNVEPGQPAMIYLWSDPDGDGDPADAQVLASAPTLTVNDPGGVFREDLPDTFVGEAGTSFFVGAIIEYPAEDAFPCPLDGTAPSTPGVSWIIGREGPFDPNDLVTGAIEYALLEDAIGIPANVVVRAVAKLPTGDCNLNGVPDECDIADGTSTDLDGNGVPDECEDCNENDVPDGWDVDPNDPDGDGLVSADCQPDGVPDECQLDDNDCNGDGIPDDCQLADNDCNENGIPDECDIDSGLSQDLNENGLPDECEDCNENDVSDEWDVDPNDPDGDGWVSPDCQPDGIPDECQWGLPDYATYAHDDGTAEAQAGSGFPADICWLNHFTVAADMEVVSFVEIMYSGAMFDGSPVTILLWSDPDGDGSPADAQVVTSVASIVTNAGQGVFVSVPIGDTFIGPSGTSFFVGAIYQDTSGAAYPILRDVDSPQGESWLSITEGVGVLDPNDLGAAPYFGRLDDFWGGNCLIRARAFSGVYPNDCNENEVPDECDIASGFSEDVDENGVPDECEDCNGNGIPDGCDVTCDGPCAAIPGCGQSADCDSNGIPDECDILDADCNDNGVPDTCDVPPLGSYSEDCNADLIPDECQLEGNDCNENGVPDGCDLGGPPIPVYAVDDGSSEDTIGLSSGGTLAWLNHFVVEPNGESLEAVRIVYASIAPDTPATVYLWNDPDNNGNPADAQVLASVSTVVQNPGADTFNYVEIPETYVGEVGTSFFVGVILQHATGEFPAPLDQNSDQGASWLAGGASVDPEDLSGATLFGQPGGFGFSGNLLVRAVPATDPPPNDCNSNGVPDECDIASGTSTDCNDNGVPDECEVPPLGDTSLDCNGNLIPDECELAEHDCDGNGVPDDCQPEDDCDDNGLLDICELDYAAGLVGQYWRSVGGPGNFSERLAVRVDPVVDFDWGSGPPHPDVPTEDFTVRWTGLLLTPVLSGEYTFFVKADDGVRLWINNTLLVDEWHPSSGDEYAATLTLLGNYAYHIRLEYYEGGGDARVFLNWRVPYGTKEIIPADALYPMLDCNGNEVPDACDLAGGTSVDDNENNMPDECEDCNDNGLLDELDVSSGFSQDCNDNGLPDECEVAGGGLADCNENGIPDDCELDEFDCDENGVHDACQVISTGLVGQYFANQTWSGSPAVARIDATVNFPHPFEPPPPLGSDHFSVRWLGSIVPPTTGAYTLIVEHDDGFAFYLNGTPLMSDGGSSTHSTVVELEAGTWYHLRLDYFENQFEQKCIFRWIPPGGNEEVVPTEYLYPIYDANENDIPDVCEFGDCNGNGLPDSLDLELGIVQDCDEDGVPDECQGNCDCDANGLLEPCEAEYASGLVGQYFASYGGPGNFSQRLLVRVDPNIDFNWGGGAPAPSLPEDKFCIRWTGTVTTPAADGTYTFYTVTDDGLRLWVDEQLLIDEWHSQSPTEWSGMITLAADTTYLIKMEYREDGGGAEASLSWEPPGGSKAIIPTEALGPMADADGDGLPDSCPLLDCNDNGVPDVEDIALGTSDDCNANCIPDECDVVPPPPDYGQAYWRFEEADGSTVVDSGPHGLDGTSNALPFRTAGVPVDPVPQNEFANTQSLNLNWQSSSSGGFFTVPDTDGLLTMGNQSFTIEAWVKLDHLSTTGGNNQRQFLCQKKPLPSQDAGLDYAVLVQRGNNAAGTTYGKTSGFSGRELQVYFGTGSGNWNVTSFLQINDFDWHHVHVAYDADHETVRFGLDEQYDTVPFSPHNRVTNDGPLRVGSHQNGVGVDNFFLRGTIDELRISRGVVPLDRLLRTEASSYSEDLNGNGIPDECESSVGDLNCDGSVDFGDINPFVLYLSNFAAWQATYPDCDPANGDIDGDGIYPSLGDINPFVALLSGGG